MAEEPKASSTPKIVSVQRRPPIGKLNDEILQSPIVSEPYESEGFSDSAEDDTDDIGHQLSSNTEFCNCVSPFLAIAVAVIFILLITLSPQGEKVQELSLNELKEEFPSQLEDFWLTVEVNIKEILKLNRPKTFLFLYDDESQKTATDIVDRVSKYATCALTNCSSVAITYEGQNLNALDIRNDYGKIIASVKSKLEESGVMIVRNLEVVSGTSAQAFHSLCDEYHPLVRKALFIFTMKVEGFNNKNVQFVEKYLHNRWSELTDDLFHPLFTRISYNVLSIVAERQSDL